MFVIVMLILKLMMWDFKDSDMFYNVIRYKNKNKAHDIVSDRSSDSAVDGSLVVNNVINLSTSEDR